MLKTLVIGLGHQSLDDHIPALMESPRFLLKAVCDIQADKCDAIAKKLGVASAPNLDEYLAENYRDIDCAIVAVPHASYVSIIKALAQYKIDIIKEKPFATNIENALAIGRAIQENRTSLTLTMQRRYNPVFTSFAQLIKRIGPVHSIEARYVMNVKKLDEGWRASRLYAGGGALIDLGYHYIDLIVWYFGLPDLITCQMTTGNREGQKYDVEDTAFLQFSYDRKAVGQQDILGNFIVSRVFPSKEEGLTAYGTRGHVSVMRGTLSRVYEKADGTFGEERLERIGSWPSALIDQLEHCADVIKNDRHKGVVHEDYLAHVAFAESAYESARLRKSVNPHDHLVRLKSSLSSPTSPGEVNE